MSHSNSIYSPVRKIAVLVGIVGGSLLISVPSFAQNEDQTAPRSQQYREECQASVERDRVSTPGSSIAIDATSAGNVPNRTDPRTLTPFERGNISQNGQRERNDRAEINRTSRDNVNSNPTRLNPSRDGLAANQVPAPCAR